jgi:hypothetical protein
MNKTLSKIPSRFKQKLSPTNAAIYSLSPRAILDAHFSEIERQHQIIEDFLRPSPAAVRRGSGELTSTGRGARQYAKVEANEKKQGLADDSYYREIENDGLLLTAVNEQTGEIVKFDISKGKPKKSHDSDHARVERFKLQYFAGKLMPSSRTAHCLRRFQKFTDEVKVLKSREFGSCSFSGLQTCGSVWACPVCAAKVSARRSGELLTAMRGHGDNGGECLMITYTFPHSREDELKDMLKRLSAATKFNKGHRNYKELRQRVHQIGTVKALEVTHGGNGWHPHIHEVWFVRSGVDCDELKADLYTCWRAACLANGFPEPSFENGVDVKKIENMEKAAEYMAKEMTAQHTKSGKSGNRSPFDLLRDYAQGDSYAGHLFEEYVIGFKRQLQLRWSNGLKALFLIDDMTDDELAAIREESSDEVGTISRDQWKVLLEVERLAPNSSPRATVLNLASIDWGLVEIYLNSLVSFSGLSSPALLCSPELI